MGSFKFAGAVRSCETKDGVIRFQLTNAKLNVYVISDNIIRFRYADKDDFSEAPSYAVVYDNKKEIPYKFTEESDNYVITTSQLIVHIAKNPCRVAIYDTKMNLINADDESFGASFDDGEVRCFKKHLPGERFYGLGEKSDNLDKTGNQYTMWNTDYPAYTTRKDPLYVDIPFFMGVKDYKAYGIFFDNTYRSYFNMGASNDRFYWFGADKGEMDYYFIYGPEMKKVVSDYTMLTGRIELPPMWALGYQQSKWSYYPEAEVRNIARNFREKKIPCDVIYLDIHYMDGYRVFTWNKERFPDPPKMLSDLKREGFKIVTIIDPGVKADSNYFMAKEGVAQNLFAKYPDNTLYKGEVWPSWAYFPDFTKQATRAWWGDKIGGFLNMGVEGIWNDMNEPAVWGQAFPDIVQFDDNGFHADHKKIHNVYGLSMGRATREGLWKHDPNKRHFILSRSGYAGIQRYTATWTGDNVANEDNLRMACIMPQNLSISGVPFCGPDAGGFIGEPSKALYTRWMELGAFTPFFRGHTELNTKSQEPWAFGDDVEFNVRNMINLRYQMLPFWYSEFYNTSKTGIPVMRPMFLNYQNDENCYYWDAQLQFMIGDNLLVAPILKEDENLKKLYLPEGNWIRVDDNKVYTGGQWIIVEAAINSIPYFLKQGGIIPMQEVQQYVGEKKITQTELLIYPGKQSSYKLYEDDGISYEYKNEKYSITDFDVASSDKAIKINVKKTVNGYQGDRKTYLFKLLDQNKPSAVKTGGNGLNELSDMQSFETSTGGFYYDNKNKILYIKTADSGNMSVDISL